MAQEKLGLFDTPPDRAEIRVALVLIGAVFIIFAIGLPTQNVFVGEIPGFIPALVAGMLVCDLISAAILYTQAAVFRSRALTVLASGYVVGGLLLIPWALSFPGAFSEGGLLGAQVNTTGWIATFWRLTLPIAVFFYALLKRTDAAGSLAVEKPPARVWVGLLFSVAITIFVTLLATLWHDVLPSFFIDRSTVIRSTLISVNVAVILCTMAAVVMLIWQRSSVLDLWLLVAMSAWLAQSLLNMLLTSRFTLGAYLFLGMTLVSNLVVMLALVTESNRLFARLAISTAARDREREARLTSMDAVAAAVAHEVGQPLAAAQLEASAALEWLARPKPEPAKAIRSLQDSKQSLRRTFDVIKSVRATFAHSTGSLTEFDLNQLVRETASLMERELAAHKVSVQMLLDDSSPAVRANRTQLQRVLINLLTNAIESITAKRRRNRNIVVRTAAMDGRRVLAEVSDNGIGIAPEKLPLIFEPFFTTKRSGTGLGLSLSRTIVEEHGGQLWATSSEAGGATFHMQLLLHPSSG